ncbi:MAG TPA: hypothetical protein VNE59_14830 [Burkholderiales bacterium]|nr:hypothetical protein [Burkholderiales bacterium]
MAAQRAARQVKIRRIVVGLEPGRRGRAALEAGAALAGHMQAELVGLFVEDVNLLHLAGLPFAREVGAASVTTRALDVAGMERALRALANDARRMLEGLAARGPVPWSFQVARGSVMAELLAASGEDDLLVAATAAWEPELAAAREALALRLGARARAAVLLLQRDLAPRAPLTAVCSVAAAPERVIAAAAELARSFGDGLRFVLVGGNPAAARKWEREARRALAARGEPARFLRVPAGDAQGLRAALGEVAPGVLMLAGAYAEPERAALQVLLGELRCPVFVLPEPVRGGEPAPA